MATEQERVEGSEGLQRKVAEALTRDVGRGFARLDPDDLARLHSSTGDIVQVSGKRPTYCRAMFTYPQTRGQLRVQLDGITRSNAGVGLDDAVTLRRADCAPAQEIVLAPIDARPSDRDMRYVGRLLDGLPVAEGDRIRAALLGSHTAGFRVVKTIPAGPVVIHPKTRLFIGEPEEAEPARGLSYEDIGGLKPQLQRIREMIELPLRFPELFAKLGIDPPKGVLLHGPPGTGKTLIARTIAHETEAQFFSVSGPEVIHKFYGESEAHLRKIFEEAARRSPSVVFLDELDAIAPARERVLGDVEKRVVAQLLASMDGLKRRERVVVIGATNIPNALDPALRRPGRFDREIAIPIPDKSGRREILEIHSHGMPLAGDVDLGALAATTHGFVGADLEALCREAAMSCLRRILPDLDLSRHTLPWEALARLEVRKDDFDAALREVEPSAIREVFVEVPDVRWSDIGGLADVKRRLIEAIEWPLHHADLFEAAGVRPPKGILLTGPPGCGKTLLAKAVATESGVSFISVKGAALLNKYVGESERAVREVFHKGRQAAPCILFFDEIDALAPRRSGEAGDSHVTERVVSQFLTELDGIEELKGVLALGATNRADLMDPALLRPGRFEGIVEISPPGDEDRTEIFAVHLRGKPLAESVDVKSFAARTPGFTGADIAALCSRAAMSALRRVIDAPEDRRGPVRVEARDLEDSLAAQMQARGASGASV